MFEPECISEVTFTARSAQDGDLELKWLGERAVIGTTLSLPGLGIITTHGLKSSILLNSTGWRMSNEYFTMIRAIKADHGRLIVTDKVFNKSDEVLPLYYSLDLSRGTDCTLGGHKLVKSKASTCNQPEFPLLQNIYGERCIGLLPRDDIFRNQSELFASERTVGLRTSHLAVPRDSSVALCWEAYPRPNADLFSLINCIRARWGVNRVQIPALFGFIYPQYVFRGKKLSEMSQRETVDWLATSGLGIVCFVVMADPVEDGHKRGNPWAEIEAFGEDYLTAKSSKNFWKPVLQKIRKARPQVKILPYFHLGANPPNPSLAPFACRVFESGTKKFVNYIGIERVYFWAANGNLFQRISEAVFLKTMDEFGRDGIYWDEYGHGDKSTYLTDADWDHCSIEMDVKSGQFLRKLSNYSLLEFPLRRKLVSKVVSGGKLLVTNYEPTTYEENLVPALHFVENVTPQNAPRGYLGTPLGCCRSTTNSPETLVKDIRTNLDLGLATVMIGSAAFIDYPASPLALCYPITPKEIHPGWILGPERIVTDRSGYFGWNNTLAAARLYIVSSKGLVRQSSVEATSIGKYHWFKINIAEGEFAILENRH